MTLTPGTFIDDRGRSRPYTPNDASFEAIPIPAGYRCWACGNPIDAGEGARVQGSPDTGLAGRVVHRSGACHKAAKRIGREQAEGGPT